MNRSILALTCLFNFAAQAQRTTSPIDQDLRNADEIRREQRREDLERNKIVVRYEKDSRRQYVFYCENKTFCTYTVTISFSQLENLQSDIPLPATLDVMPGAGQYSAYRKPKDYYVWGIHMHSGDTIYAARRGRVTDVSDDVSLTDSGYTYAKEENYVEIAHDDCSFGKYIVFRDSSIFVQPGDWVEAGQPLGIVGGEHYAEGPHIRFSVRYHLEQPILDKDGQPTERTEYWAYVPVNFWVKNKGKIHLAKGTTYTSELPVNLVTKEMSKKAARKWKEAHPTATP